MRTRKSTRKSITLQGRYFTGLGTPEEVMLADLSVGGCRFNVGDRKVMLGAPLQIYVGASGPHRAVIKWVKGEEVGVTFTTPLSETHFESFQTSHIPDPAAKNVADGFEEMGDTAPQRFC